MSEGIHSLGDFDHRFLCMGHRVVPIFPDLRFLLFYTLESSPDGFLQITFIYGIFLMTGMHPHCKRSLLVFGV